MSPLPYPHISIPFIAQSSFLVSRIIQLTAAVDRLVVLAVAFGPYKLPPTSRLLLLLPLNVDLKRYL